MKKKKVSRIPDFKTYEEEANFWDTHSFTDFEDELEEVDMVVRLHQPKEDTLILRLQRGMKDRMSRIAKRKGLRISALARMWIVEKLRSSNISASV